MFFQTNLSNENEITRKEKLIRNSCGGKKVNEEINNEGDLLWIFSNHFEL